MSARRMITLAGLAAAATVALSACGGGYPLAPVAQPAVTQPALTQPAVAPVASTATDAGSAAGAAVPDRAGSGSGGTAAAKRPTTGGGHGSPTAGQDTPTAPVAAIAGFRVVSKPVCAVHGTPDAPFSTPGSGVTIAWSVTGADGAALAVDNPTTYGAYGTSYPAKGQQEFPFTCEPGTTTSHTFTVWPAGAKGTSKTLTVSAHSDG